MSPTAVDDTIGQDHVLVSRRLRKGRNMGNIICQDVCKKYKENEVLDHVNLTIDEGKIYGLIGRNGAGKTTLLSIMSAQNPVTSGQVTVDGMPVWENEKALANICFSRELGANTINGANTLKVKDYLRCGEIFYPNWDKEYANELIDHFKINKKLAINKLSKGMMSMVTIIIALASKAKYTFLDEPVAGLDVVARNDFYRLLLDEYAKTGRTFIVSTHIIDEASDIFEEVIIVKDKGILLKENTVSLLERAVHVSGNAADVDEVIKAHAAAEVMETQTLGRSKGVSMLLQEGDSIKQDAQIMVQPLTLQNLFMALCREDEAHE